MNLKEKLLNLGLVKDNQYLDRYIELIEKNKETKKEKFKTNKHHIIPRYYYKYNNFELDNSKENFVNLLYKDHILAHYYLSLCSSNGYFKYSNINALSYIQTKYKINTNDLIDNLDNYQDLYSYLIQYKASMRKGKPFPHTLEWNKKISLANKGKRLGISPPNKGVHGVFHHTEEAKIKIGKAAKGRNVSQETREKLSIINKGNKNKLGYKASPHTCTLQSVNNGRNIKIRCIETNELFYNLNECFRQTHIRAHFVRLLCESGKPYKPRMLSRWTDEEKEKYRKYYNCHFKIEKEN